MDDLLGGLNSLLRNNSHIVLACVAGYALYRSERELASYRNRVKQNESRIVSLEQELENERSVKGAMREQVGELQRAVTIDCRRLVTQLESIIKQFGGSRGCDLKIESHGSHIPVEPTDDDLLSEDSSEGHPSHHLTSAIPSARAQTALASLSTMIDQRNFEPKDRAKYILLCLLNAYEVYLDEEMFMDDTLAVTPLASEMVAHFKEKIAEEFDIDEKIGITHDEDSTSSV